jgi:hypothetical protein
MNDISAMNNEATRAFIRLHRNDDVRRLALKGSGQGGSHPATVDMPFALDQIAGWQMARTKLPTYAATDGIVFPPHLNMEQCSSEATARYKARIAERHQAPLLIDLTGGFGIDFSFLAPCFAHAVYVERNERLCAIARHNFGCLGLANTKVVCGDGEDYLHQLRAQVDSGSTQPSSATHSRSALSSIRPFIFIDPARRDANGHKVFGIADCTPDVLSLKDELMAAASCVMIKLSPMLDWHAAARAFAPYCREVHIVSVGNECKELLLVLLPEPLATPLTSSDESRASAIRLVCANDAEIFEQPVSFDLTSSFAPEPIVAPAEVDRATAVISEPFSADEVVGASLCVPNASIMKAGIFMALTRKFGVRGVDRDSHLFLGQQKVNGFPGRQFRIMGLTTMNKRELRNRLAGITKANIAVRNFPLSADALRKRLKLKDGGSCYLFATTMQGRHVIFITQPWKTAAADGVYYENS